MSTLTLDKAAPVEQLAALLDYLDLQEERLGQPERNEHRRGVSSPIELGVLSGPDHPDAGPNPENFRGLYPAWLTDASRSGLGLLTETELPNNIRLWADLSRLAGEPLLLPVRVVYCMKVLRSTYRVGTGFNFSDEQLAA
ncbi:hypothetical protein [Mucisphaera calidilacus]|uniref:PilZ domain-containing protein n=1 Tax=Mucisphaera calidilacus TaxID=2527982 RepID=A0A518C0W0_9BACT|nr:hypothetical protein [Mucisphaera calidilacus]QDU72848.1 hypothetical protein Pan265_27240 [Mucisphaera calidilacus]